MDANKPILIACEESGVVTKAFIELGFTNVYSCDLMETSGEYPDRHIIGDVLPILNGNCRLVTSNGVEHEVPTQFSLIIAFPPCTHLAVSGARYFAEKRADGRQQQGIDFFMQFVNCNCAKVVIENPIGIMSSLYRKPDQIIHPYMFGDPFSKPTCLWVSGVPKLVIPPQDEWADKGEFKTSKSGHRGAAWNWWLPPGPERAKIRSKTFPGIARAMANAWGRNVNA